MYLTRHAPTYITKALQAILIRYLLNLAHSTSPDERSQSQIPVRARSGDGDETHMLNMPYIVPASPTVKSVMYAPAVSIGNEWHLSTPRLGLRSVKRQKLTHVELCAGHLLVNEACIVLQSSLHLWNSVGTCRGAAPEADRKGRQRQRKSSAIRSMRFHRHCIRLTSASILLAS